MCGIVGVLNSSSGFQDRYLLEEMTSRLTHRGPDGHHIFMEGPVGLGHTRLTILDLSKAGRQPMHNEDKTVWITFNGEIYNCRSLHRELEEKGHKFLSTTDTEVIIHAYEEWGIDCLERLTGMFAFGIWDSSKKRLWLARDRIGIKPLFYAHLPQALVFASEIKSLLCHPGLRKSIDYEADLVTRKP